MSEPETRPPRATPSLADSRHKPGEKVGGYVLEKPLGRGGFSEVWLARTIERQPLPSVFDPGHWTPVEGARPQVARVALKLLVHDEHVAELKQEAKALGVVRGEGIVRTLEANLEHDPPYLALEYHPGGDLREKLATAGGRFPPARALWLVERLLETLTRVHREGIVHGDLKPENVLFDKDGSPLLADFGLSRRILQRTGTLSVSLSHADARLAGTIDYMAPEQRAGEKPTLRSDVFAIGVILHELVFGERPQGFVKKATERDPRLPPLADRILEHALAPDPRDRFENAGAFLKALRVELWNDARSLEATSKGLRERVVLGHAWTLVWGAVAAGAWLVTLLGESNGRTRLWDLFDLDLVTGAVAASLPFLLVRPLARRWRTRHSAAHVRIAQQLETLDGWRKVSPENDENEGAGRERAANAAAASAKKGCRGVAQTLLAAVGLMVLVALVSKALHAYSSESRKTRAAILERAIADAQDQPGTPPWAHDQAVAEIVAFDRPEATLALVGLLALEHEDGDALRLQESLELFASAPGPRDPRVGAALEKVLGTTSLSNRTRFAAAYGLEELASPAFPEPPEFAPGRNFNRGFDGASFERAVRSVAPLTDYEIDAGPATAFPAPVTGLLTGRPWRVLVQLAQRPPEHALLVHGRKVSFERRARWIPAGFREGPALAADLGNLLGRPVVLRADAKLGPGPGNFGHYDPLKALRAAAAMNGCDVRETTPGGSLEVAPKPAR